MKKSYNQPKQIVISAQTQKGAALVVSLFILLVMTLIGITSLNTSLLEEKMSSNTQLKTASFQDAEAAINAAIREVESPTSGKLKTALKNSEDETDGPVITPPSGSGINGTVGLEYIEDRVIAGYSMDKYSGLLLEFRGNGKPPAPHDTGKIVTKNTQAGLRPAIKP